jgi:hypothetical protein
MENSTEFLIRLLSDFSQLRRRMKGVAEILRSGISGASVRHGIDFVTYGARHVIEIFIDVALGGGKSLCWWIDIEHVDESWKVEASLRRDDGAGEDSIWKASYKATTVDELFSHLSIILDEMERFANQKGKHFV